MRKKQHPRTVRRVDWTCYGWSRRRSKKENARGLRRLAKSIKGTKSNHRLWTWAAQELLRWGEVYWAVKRLHHRRKAALKRSTER